MNPSEYYNAEPANQSPTGPVRRRAYIPEQQGTANPGPMGPPAAIPARGNMPTTKPSYMDGYDDDYDDLPGRKRSTFGGKGGSSAPRSLVTGLVIGIVLVMVGLMFVNIAPVTQPQPPDPVEPLEFKTYSDENNVVHYFTAPRPEDHGLVFDTDSDTGNPTGLTIPNSPKVDYYVDLDIDDYDEDDDGQVIRDRYDENGDPYDTNELMVIDPDELDDEDDNEMDLYEEEYDYYKDLNDFYEKWRAYQNDMDQWRRGDRKDVVEAYNRELKDYTKEMNAWEEDNNDNIEERKRMTQIGVIILDIGVILIAALFIRTALVSDMEARVRVGMLIGGVLLLGFLLLSPTYSHLMFM